MSTGIVITLTGPDRVGIVEDVTRITLSFGGNVETSRMVRLGGEFAVLMLVSVPSADRDIEGAFAPLTAEGYRLTISQTGKPSASASALYTVEVVGADHEGIIHEIAAKLAAAGINIESMETGTVPSPITGTPLFAMKALIAVPAAIDEVGWMQALSAAGDAAGVDVTVTAADR